jgi:hypothetical protein
MICPGGYIGVWRASTMGELPLRQHRAERPSCFGRGLISTVAEETDAASMPRWSSPEHSSIPDTITFHWKMERITHPCRFYSASFSLPVLAVLHHGSSLYVNFNLLHPPTRTHVGFMALPLAKTHMVCPGLPGLAVTHNGSHLN